MIKKTATAMIIENDNNDKGISGNDNANNDDSNNSDSDDNETKIAIR